MYFTGAGVLLLSDSICKYVSGIHGLEVKAFPGIGISRMAGECSKDCLRSLLLQKSVVIVHVGTNDVSRFDAGQIVSNLNGLFFKIREANSHIQIMYSAILPKPNETREINDKIKTINLAIEKMCKARKFPFLHTYRPFIDKNGQYHRHMFAARDNGLHLNLEGSRVLSNFFLQIVKRVR